jgi:hypothetical protein
VGFAFGVEVAAGVAAESFDKVVDAFGQVGGAEEGVSGSGEVVEGQIVGGAWFEVFDPGGAMGTEFFQEALEALEGRVVAGGGVDFAPSLAVELVAFFVQVAEGVAVEVNGAKLVLAVGEKALQQAGQAGEVIGDKEQAAGEAAVFEVQEDFFPEFQVFVAPEGLGGEDFLFSFGPVANDQEVDGFEDVVVFVFEVDDFGVDEEGVPIGRERPAIEVFGFQKEFVEQVFELFWGVAQVEGLEGADGGFEGFGLEKDLAEEFGVSFGDVALVFGKDGRVEALAGAGDFNGDWSGSQVKRALWRVAIGAIVGGSFEVELALELKGTIEELTQALDEEGLELLFGQEGAQDFVVGDFGGDGLDAVLQFGDRLVSVHMEIREGRESVA